LIFVWVIFATFNLSCCKVTLNPHSYIAKVHAIIVASSYFNRTLVGPIFLDLVLPFKWSYKEVRSIHQWELAFHNEWVLCSTTSIASSKDWFVHVPFSSVWEFHLTQGLWCWDDVSWLGIYCVSATDWLDFCYVIIIGWLGLCDVFDAS
jgi:hypothetical protein